MKCLSRVLLSLCMLPAMLGFAATRASAADSWTGFQNGGALTRHGAPAPQTWSPDQGVSWDVALAGYGQSSPVVEADQVYVTSTAGELKEKLFVEAFDRHSGKRLWVHEAKNSSPTKNTLYVSRAAPTPVCDADGVIAFFEGGNLVALDHQGQLRWTRDLVAEFGAIASRHGLGSSLEQDETHVYVWVERDEGPYVLAVAKKSGATVWKVDGLGVTSWSSPRLVPVGEGTHLVLSGSGKIAGLDPESGKRLWTFDDITGNTTPTPIPLGDGRFLIGASVGRGETANASRAAESNGVIQIETTASGAFQASFVWRATKATSSFGSPIAYQGLAYFVNRSGVVYCLDLETGEQLYAQRSAGSIWATPVAVDDRIYLFGKDGTTTVLQSGKQFQELAVNHLWVNKSAAEPAASRGNFGGPTLYAGAIVGRQVLLRRGDRLYAIGG